MQEKLQEADKDKAVEAQSAKAEVQDLQGLITSLKAEVLDQKQQLNAQQSKPQAASDLEAHVTQLEGQLEEQRKVITAKEDQAKKITAAKKEQEQEVASLKARLAEVCSVPIVTSCQYLCGFTVLLLHGIT